MFQVSNLLKSEMSAKKDKKLARLNSSATIPDKKMFKQAKLDIDKIHEKKMFKQAKLNIIKLPKFMT